MENDDYKDLTEFVYLLKIKDSAETVMNAVQQNLYSIKSWENIGFTNICDILNINLLKKKINDSAVKNQISSYFMHNMGKYSFKVQLGLGLILTQKDTARYWRPSHNHGFLFKKPKNIMNQRTLYFFMQDLLNMDLFTAAQQSAPADRDSSTDAALITNVSLYVYKTENKLGCTKNIPTYIKRFKCLIPLIYQKHEYTRTKKIITDSLCMFRCLALSKFDFKDTQFSQNMSQIKYIKVEKRSKEMFREWAQHKSIDLIEDNFGGVTLAQFTEISNFFAINCNVYKFDDEENRFVRFFISEPKYIGRPTAHILLVNSHLMYVKDALKLCKGFYCNTCKKSFFKKEKMIMHAQDCTSVLGNFNGTTEKLELPSKLIKLRTLHHLIFDKSKGLRTRCQYVNTRINIFRCLSILKIKGVNSVPMSKKDWEDVEANTENLVKIWCTKHHQSEVILTKEDYENFCQLFGVNLIMYEYTNDDEGFKPYFTNKSFMESESIDTLYTLYYQGHIMHIHNYQTFLGNCYCASCNQVFLRKSYLSKHLKKKSCNNKNGTKTIYKSGIFQPSTTWYHVFEQYGITIPHDLRYMQHRIIFDFEASLSPLPLQGNCTPKTVFVSQHKPLSFAMGHNFYSNSNPETFYAQRRDDTEESCKNLIFDFYSKLRAWSKLSFDILEKKHMEFLKKVKRLIKNENLLYEEHSRDFEDDDSSMFYKVNMPEQETQSQLEKAFELLLKDLKQVVVLGFASSHYDLPLISKYLYPLIAEGNKNDKIIKRNGSPIRVGTEDFVFKDIYLYIDPSYSLSAYCDAWGGDLDKSKRKSIFPYTWCTGTEVLLQKTFPSLKEFCPSLGKQEREVCTDYGYTTRVLDKHISNEAYQEAKDIYESTCKNMGEWLKFYNMLDITPLFICVQRNFDFYVSLKVDMFKDANSVPALALKVAQSLADSKTNRESIYLFGNEYSNLQDDLRAGIKGGLSITLHRLLISDKSVFPDDDVYGTKGQICKAIIGYDASSQYLGATSQPMPCGPLIYYTFKESNNGNFHIQCSRMNPNSNIKDNQSSEANEYLRYLEYHLGSSTFQHSRSPSGERKIGPKAIPCDGYHIPSKTVYQFHGCYWHACDCMQPPENSFDYIEWNNRRQKTEKMNNYHRIFSNNFVIMRGCEWNKLKETSSSVQEFLRYHLKSEYPDELNFDNTSNKTICADVTQKILTEDFFGLVKCDLHVPEHLKKYFSPLQPIVKNVMLTLNDVSPVMRQFALANKIMSESGKRRQLIASYFGEKTIIITPYLKWLLNKGLIITKVYNIYQYTPHACYEKFKDAVISARKEATKDPAKALIAKSMKLLGNTFFGKCASRVSSYKEYSICSKKTAQKRLRDIRFNSLQELGSNTYEVCMEQRNINECLPVIVAYFVYDYAKLNLYQFIYDFIDYYIPRSHYMPLVTDTDRYLFYVIFTA